MFGIVEELIVAVEVAVLDDHRHVIRPGARARHGELFLVIPDVEQPGQAHHDLLGGAHVRVRMEPVGPGAVDHLEFVDLGLAGSNRLHRLPVAVLGHAQAVRMNDTVFGQVVVEEDAHLGAALRPQDRPEIVMRGTRFVTVTPEPLNNWPS